MSASHTRRNALVRRRIKRGGSVPMFAASWPMADPKRVGSPKRADSYGKKPEHGLKSYDFASWKPDALLRRYKPRNYCVQSE